MHRILKLKASAKHTQFRNLEVSVSLLTRIISLIHRREKKFLEKHDVMETQILCMINSCLTNKKGRSLYRSRGRRHKVGPLSLQK